MKYKIDLLRYLNEHGISMSAAAKAAGMLPQNIRKSIENNPKSGTVVQIANNLGLDPRDFFYAEDDEGNEINLMPKSIEAITQKPEPLTEAQSEEQFTPAQQEVQTIAFCPHCGGKVKVGVVLLAEED